MYRKEDYIAVFDSGVGGISVLRQLRKLMPDENYIYYGDSANAPYGSRTTEQVRSLTLAAAEIPSYISYEVFLSYIGMGISQMSLGKLIQSAQSAMLTPGWGMEFWSPVAVASAITVVLYVIGQNLGDASDPKRHV